MKKCIVAQSVSYPVGLKSAKVEKTDQNTEQKRLDTGESYRVAEAQSENKTEERRLGTDLLTEFVQGASKSECVED
jgi:hypothetical protein